MSCGVSAASQRQISGATKPRRTRHPWEGFCGESCGFPGEPQQHAAIDLIIAASGFPRESFGFSREPLSHQSVRRGQSSR